MTLGPIEFPLEGQDLALRVAHSEFAGAPGLIQPELAPDGTEGHSLDASEIARGMVRAGFVVEAGPWGVGVDPGVVVDPASGREIRPSDHQDVTGTGGKFSDMQI